MSKKYSSVAEMIKEMSSDSAFRELVSKEINDKKVGKYLFYLRCKHNLSQKQIAEKLGCTQSRISKIESSIDKDLSINDLLDYAKALNLQLEIGYRNRTAKIVDLIKYHAFKIKEYLHQLTTMAKDDESLQVGVAKFRLEAFTNISVMISDSYSKLGIGQKKQAEEKSPIHISVPLENSPRLEENSMST